ncbi:MAG TPA: hypothetical protein VFV58_16880 [Blastocatellia bacterium]|jgi:hypothetical protein|nr:hypothetical protein [Blastocatellia bacterium]
MPWPLSRERLRELLAKTEQHIASIRKSIERQERLIADLEAAGRGKSEIAETLRALLATMQKAEGLYRRDRERIKRWLAE